jgi:ABC-type branched-subunit amino acid transport system substrate-binding protein
MSAKAISKYLNKHFNGKRYFYITADNTWGWSTESSLRKLTNTEDTKTHPGVLTPFPSKDFRTALREAQAANPEVLVLVLFGDEMAKAVRTAAKMGMKDRMQIVVPNLTIGMAERGTPTDMEGVIGAVPWTWKVPYAYSYDRGKQFKDKYHLDYFDFLDSISGQEAVRTREQWNAVRKATNKLTRLEEL